MDEKRFGEEIGRLPTMMDPSADRDLPAFDRRRRARNGVRLLGGLDEAGRGALAGPVVCAVVVLGPGTRLPGLDDSKQLTAARRERLAPLILERAADWALGQATAAEVDRVNVLEATRMAAGRALMGLACPPERLLTDCLELADPPCPIEAIVDGDAQSQAIAAASVLAKVARDRVMAALDAQYPAYGLARHKGYGTRAHWAAIEAHGPSTLHRLSYKGVCFFSNTPAVWARDGRRAGPPPAPDWSAVLGQGDGLDGRLFLPEAEWA